MTMFHTLRQMKPVHHAHCAELWPRWLLGAQEAWRGCALLCILAFGLSGPAQAQIIDTVAGTGLSGFSGDGGPAVAGQLSHSYGVALDVAGNLYFADTSNQRVRKVHAITGVVSTFAGTGWTGSDGDGGPAADAELNYPSGLAFDSAGNLYISESLGHRVRKVDALTSQISTVAGTGQAGFSGDGVPATAAALNGPQGLAIDSEDNLYITEATGLRIRRVDAATGHISTAAGNGSQGSSGDGGPATAAQLNGPFSIAVDSQRNLYIAESHTHRIRKVNASTGIISTVAGNGTAGFSGDGGASTAAQLNVPRGLAVGAHGDLYIGDAENHRIRKVDSAGKITTAVGSGLFGFGGDGGVATAARLTAPMALTVDAAGSVYFVDFTAFRIRKVTTAPPGAPTAAVAVPGDTQTTVSWTEPTNDGLLAINSYTVTAVEDNTKTCTPTPSTATTCVVPGLANGTSYTFTVVASNSKGSGPASTPSTAVTPLGVPGAPTQVTALAGNAQATASWTAPAITGGGPITSYTVTGAPAGTCTVAAPATTCVVPTLANGTPHTFTVVANNALWPSQPSSSSTPVTPKAPPVVDPGPSNLPINSPGALTTITEPHLPIVIGPEAGGSTIVLPGSGSNPVPLQVTINGQPLVVQATPGSYLRIAQVNGQNVLVLVVIQGWASIASTASGQPMALAGDLLLSAGTAGTRIEAQPFTVAVLQGSLLTLQGSLPQLGDKGLQAGEKLLVDAEGKLVSITLGSLNGDAGQAGDGMNFSNLPAAITVDGKSFARLDGALARLAGANLAQGLEIAPTGVVLLRDGGQFFQLLPTLPITIDATLPDGVSFTPLGMLRWVRGGVAVLFSPAVADLAGLATAVTAALPGATLKLGAEGVLQLSVGGQTYVLRPDWTGAGMATGTPQIGVDEQGRIVLQLGNGPGQLLLPALLNAAQASSIFTTAIPGATLAVQAGSGEGALKLTLDGRSWRLVPHWVLQADNDAGQSQPWRMGNDGLLYLKLGTQVQGLRISD